MVIASPVPVIVRALCIVGALVCALIALSAYAGAAGTAANLGLAFANPAGQVEFLTFYGGFYLGLAVFFLIGLRSRAIATGAMAFLALSNVGALVGRVTAMAALATSSGLLVALAIAEIILAGLGAAGWYRMSRSA